MGAERSPSGLIDRLKSHVSDRELDALEACAQLCTARKLSLFLVGGAVRDLLLDRETIDLDLAIEGEVEPVAQPLAESLDGRLVFHPRFGTAKVSAPALHVDLARTRRETYARPGALPAVEPASLADDLARRDFTINALALRLTQPAGELVDPFGGVADVERGLVRVLHERSFQDDATRMLRAARYAGRLGFQIEAQTESWLRRDLAFLDTISGPRLRRELTSMFSEDRAVDEALRAGSVGVLGAVHPALGLDEKVAARWRAALAGTHYGPLDELGFCVLAGVRDESSVQSLSRRLHLAGRLEDALLDIVRLQGLSAKLAASFDAPGAVVEILDGRAPAAVWALAVREAGGGARVCYAYLRDWRRIRPHLRGDGLLALGVPPGKAVGEMLRKLRRARIEGLTKTRADEIELVRAELRAL